MQKNCIRLPSTTNTWNTECIYRCFLPSPYSTAPTVYAMPPNSSHYSPGSGIALMTVGAANTIHQPMPI